MTLRHPNILQFLGANTMDDRPFVVMPLLPYNARDFLQTQPDFDPLYILRDISLGLEYLHARKICHGDLKGINVLVEDSGRALLCDFGLARIKADITSRTRTAADSTVSGSRNWMAPELLSGSLPRTPSDIYAFGMTLYELYTGEIPMSAVPHNDFIELVFRLGVRPDRPDEDECPGLGDAIWDLAERCWDKDPKVRPTARQLHDEIKILITKGPATGNFDDEVKILTTEPAAGRIVEPNDLNFGSAGGHRRDDFPDRQPS
ncbi:kinase-like domain-containing protein [Mycena leptocephala]|nr:kinase-like domain-containing protein [Mycena leptocephala]